MFPPSSALFSSGSSCNANFACCGEFMDALPYTHIHVYRSSQKTLCLRLTVGVFRMSTSTGPRFLRLACLPPHPCPPSLNLSRTHALPRTRLAFLACVQYVPRSLRVSFTLRLGTTGSEKEQGCIENHEGVMHTYTRTHSGTVPWSSRVHCSVGHQACRTHVQRGRDEDSACNLRPNRYSPPKSLRQDFKTRVVYDGP